MSPAGLRPGSSQAVEADPLEAELRGARENQEEAQRHLAELQAQTEAGKTLADIADAEGVDQADLVAALVEAEQARLDAAVNLISLM